MTPIDGDGSGRVGRFFSDDRIQPPKDGNARGVGNDKRLRRKRARRICVRLRKERALSGANDPGARMMKDQRGFWPRAPQTKTAALLARLTASRTLSSAPRATGWSTRSISPRRRARRRPSRRTRRTPRTRIRTRRRRRRLRGVAVPSSRACASADCSWRTRTPTRPEAAPPPLRAEARRTPHRRHRPSPRRAVVARTRSSASRARRGAEDAEYEPRPPREAATRAGGARRARGWKKSPEHPRVPTRARRRVRVRRSSRSSRSTPEPPLFGPSSLARRASLAGAPSPRVAL